MAVSKKSLKGNLRAWDVYEQTDGSLLVLPEGEYPETYMTPIWSGEAVDERQAIEFTRTSKKQYRNAATANPDHNPDTAGQVRKSVEEETNKRLGITPPKKRVVTKKKLVKASAARTVAAKKLTGKKKSVKPRRK